MKMLTLQEIFNTAALGLLKQGERSTGIPEPEVATAQCLYRGINGMKCAAGFLITDEVYAKYGADDLEGAPVAHSPTVQDALKDSGVDTDDKDVLDLITQSQRIHDTELPYKWACELQTIAHTFKLTMPEIPA